MPPFLLAAGLLPILLMSFVGTPVGAVVVILRGVGDGLLLPVVYFYLNRVVGEQARASVLSIATVVARLAQAAVLATLGLALERISFGATLHLSWLAGLLAAVAVLWLGPGGIRAWRRGAEQLATQDSSTSLPEEVTRRPPRS
jgi:hypothetical protein